MRLFVVGLVVAAVVGPVSAQAACSAVYGKSVTVNWNEPRSQRAVGQEAGFHPVSIPFALTVYISTEGHIFRRMFAVASTGRTSGAKEAVGPSSGANGGDSSIQF